MKVNGNVVFGSDIRIKQNIKNLTNSLNRLKQLQSVSYNFKEEGVEIDKILEKFLKEDINIDSLKTELSNAPTIHLI